MKDNKSDKSRRKLLKSIAAGSGAIVAGKSLPESWSRPVVDSVMLPAHAMTSPGNQYTNSQQMVLLDNQSRLARVMDSLVPEANAGPENGATGPTEITCLTITGESIVRIEGLITNSSGSSQVVAQNVTVGGAAVPMTRSHCDPSSGIGQTTVQVATLTNTSATGTYNIGGGTNIVPFTVTPGACSAPACPPALSDIRLKTNIEALSISRKGYNLYKFQYIDENNENTYVGVMAQDIISRNPEAVIQNESGFYMVRYARLGLKMVTLKQWESEGPDSVELMH